MNHVAYNVAFEKHKILTEKLYDERQLQLQQASFYKNLEV